MSNDWKNGFTLVELLVAMSIALVVGGAILSSILFSFRSWEQTVLSAGTTRAENDFDLDFSRDFASACSALGFSGTSTECEFWTLKTANDNTLNLVKVKYSIDSKGVFATYKTLLDSPESDGIVKLYKTDFFKKFDYNGTNMPIDVWCQEWQAETNMPSMVAVSSQSSSKNQLRKYLRRTE